MQITRRTIKYRLYPTPAQETKLRETLETCRAVYNSMVNWRKHDYEVSGKSPSFYDQNKALPVWKLTHPELCDVNAQVLQDVCKRVDLAFQAFFRRVKAGDTPGYPRMKGAGNYDSLTYWQNGFALQSNSLRLSKIGVIKAVVHRDLPGTVKACTVRIQAGKWFACLSCEVEEEPLPPSEEQVGLDVGLEHFAVTNNGQFIENPRFFRKEEKALAKAQHKVDKLKTARTQEQKAKLRKARKVVSRVHERTRNRRHDFVHQTSRRLVNRYGFIAVEALQVQNMSARPKPKQDAETGQYLPNGACRKVGLNKSILDAAWSMFRSCLTYKAESAGRKVVEVSPAYTSQDCSGCGNRVQKALSCRVHICLCCGLTLNRDVNAARNILKNGVGQHTVNGDLPL